MNRRDPSIVGAGLLLLMASGVILLAEFGPNVDLPVEFVVGPLIGVALIAIVLRNAQRTRPV